MNERSCATCYFYAPHTTKEIEPACGDCRRRPPTIIPSTPRIRDITTDGTHRQYVEILDVLLATCFPIVTPGCWCGEHSPKALAEETDA